MIVINIRKSDLKRETFLVGGNGGHNVNNRYTGVRYTYIPTNISADCTEERSQFQNDKKALSKLRNRLIAYYRVIEVKTTRPPSKEIIRTYHAVDNYVVDYASDHKQTYKEVVDKGELGEMIKMRFKSAKTNRRGSGRI